MATYNILPQSMQSIKVKQNQRGGSETTPRPYSHLCDCFAGGSFLNIIQ